MCPKRKGLNEDLSPEARVRLMLLGDNVNTVNIMGETIRDGDVVEITMSYREPPKMYRFRGFNTHLFLFKLENESGDVEIIKYDQIKKIRLFKK